MDMPTSGLEETDARIVILMCMDTNTKRIIYPTLEDTKTLFQMCWNKIEYIRRGVKCGTVEVLFKNNKHAEDYAEETVKK